jgi:hypothetical protein
MPIHPSRSNPLIDAPISPLPVNPDATDSSPIQNRNFGGVFRNIYREYSATSSNSPIELPDTPTVTTTDDSTVVETVAGAIDSVVDLFTTPNGTSYEETSGTSTKWYNKKIVKLGGYAALGLGGLGLLFYMLTPKKRKTNRKYTR